MRLFILILFLTPRLGAAGVPVSGQVFLTRQACSGGPVTRAAWPRGRLLVRSGRANSARPVLAVVKTDRQGFFHLSLAPGLYCLLRPGKRDVFRYGKPNPVSEEDEEHQPLPRHPAPSALPDCRALEQQACDAILRVPASGLAGAQVELWQPCHDPCQGK